MQKGDAMSLPKGNSSTRSNESLEPTEDDDSTSLAMVRGACAG